MKPQHRFSIGYIVAAFVVLLLVQNLLMAERIHQMP